MGETSMSYYIEIQTNPCGVEAARDREPWNADTGDSDEPLWG